MSENFIDARVPPALPRRCRNCFYVIDNLGNSGVCPECGLAFSMADPMSYATRIPVAWWNFWLPGLIAATLTGLACYLVLLPTQGFGLATTFAIPLAIGVVAGTTTNIGKAAVLLVSLFAAVGAIGGALSMNMVGVFCGLVLAMLAVIPAIVGALVGMAVRGYVTRRHSRIIYSSLLGFLLVLALAKLEGPHSNQAVVLVSTTATVRATQQATWDAIQFYEEVYHKPPLLLRLTPTFRPMYTKGHSEHIGDIKICVYERGRLVKKVTQVEEGSLLAFDVIEQTDIQNRGARLIDGSFALSPHDDRTTTVTLTTRYQPLLEPRFAFAWAEAWAIHTLHGHVLEGMRRRAEKPIAVAER